SQIVRSEAGDRAVHDGPWQVCGPDPEAVGDSGPEAFEHDVGSAGKGRAEVRIPFAIPDDRLLASVESRVPTRSNRAKGIALGRLHPDDPRAAAKELAAREWTGQMSREIDDQQAAEHHPATLAPVPLPAMHAGFRPAITLRQSPPSPLPRLPAFAAG